VTVLLGLVAGALVAAALRRGMAEVLTLESLQRENYRGHRLPTAVGLVLVAAVVLVDGARTFAGVVGISDAATAPERLLMLSAVVAFGFLGVIDDLLGDGRDRGLRGHITAAMRGRITTGFVKLGAGAAVALVLAGAAVGDRPARVLIDGALVALAANLANLFDRAPGRTTKVALLAYVPIAVAAGTAAVGVALAVVVGAAAALLVGDLRERHMLGDAGANALGAALGLAVVLATSPGVRTGTAIGILALTLLSEVVSFSRIIAATPPLRLLDRLGRLPVGGALVALLVVGAVVGALPAPAAAGEPEGGRRLLVVSVPGVTWSELQDADLAADLPALAAFLETAAVADLAPRGVSPRSTPGDAYLTMSAGTRSTSERAVDGQVLALDEQSSGSAAGEIFRRRTGLVPDGEFVALSWPALVRANAGEPYDAVLGLLGDTLAEAGAASAAIGNADGTDSIGASYERQVGLALADSDGVLADGVLTDDDLVAGDPSRPFGVRLDEDAVVTAFTEAWGAAEAAPSGLVLVEASDLARVMRYRPFVDAARYRDMRALALADTDALLARLLAEVDPTRDSVVVVAPYNLPGRRDLTMIGLRTPETEPGYLTSASTQRSGFATLVDLAPTFLTILGIDRPVEMEGRPLEVVDSGDGLDARIDRLVSLNAASRFRERLLVPTTMVLVVLTTVLAAATVFLVASRRAAFLRPWLGRGALLALGALPGTYLARALPLEDLGTGVYWAVVAGVGGVAATLATVAGRRTGRPDLALQLVLGLVGVVLVADVMTGSKLSLSAAFGYSPTGNSRLYGISNYSYGQLATAACILAAYFVGWEPERKGRAVGFGLLGAVLVVLGVPIWGSDVGGVLAFAPTIALFVAIVTGRRIRLRLLVFGGLAAAAAITVFGFLDLSRPPEQRAHLGRLFERVGNEGLEPLLSIMERKLLANLNVSTSSFWVAAIPVAIAFWVFLRRFPTKPIDALRARIPGLRAGLAAATVAAVLGSLVNDSGAIVGGVAAMVITASLVHLVASQPDPDPA
jgi:hypothetical protein